MMPDSKEKWQIKIKSDFSETDNNNYLFYICKNEYWVSLEESAKLDSSQEDLIYQFTEIITRDNSFLEYLLKRAIPSALESPYDLAVQFLERLREILEGGTNRQEKTRLLFELIAIEGRFSHTENRILNLFRTAVGMQAVKSLSLKVEKKVLRIATTKEGLFKAAVSDQIIKEVVLWLTQRGAVDRLRLLFRPLPFVFRYDPIRAFFLFVIFLGGLALITHYGGSLEGFTALIVSIFAGIIVMWILLAPVRMTQTSRWAVGLRPAFMFRWHSLICWVLIALTGSVIGKFVALVSTTTAIAILFFGVFSAGWFWCHFCSSTLKKVPNETRFKTIYKRATMLLALNFEEAFAIALVVDVLNAFIFNTIDSSQQNVKAFFTIFGLKFSQTIVVDLGFFSFQIRPACTITLIGCAMIFSWIVVLNRSRVQK